jgi:hypothetical protein
MAASAVMIAAGSLHSFRSATQTGRSPARLIDPLSLGLGLNCGYSPPACPAPTCDHAASSASAIPSYRAGRAFCD